MGEQLGSGQRLGQLMIPAPTGSTALGVVIGKPISHSLSPVLYNAAFAATGFDAVFCALEVGAGEGASAVSFAKQVGMLALTVTMPLKAEVLLALDSCSQIVERLGAANVIVIKDGRAIGYSTDGEGFLDSLRLSVGFDPKGHKCGLIGAGGAARAVSLALGSAGAREVLVVNRNQARAQACAALAGATGRVGNFPELAACDLVVNATPVGMASVAAGEVPVGEEVISERQVVADLVYEPADTAFLQMARSKGARTVGGLGMLVYQAVRAFELMTGQVAPVQAMWEAVGGPRRSANGEQAS
jgi:shikimate dehydrogenase